MCIVLSHFRFHFTFSIFIASFQTFFSIGKAGVLSDSIERASKRAGISENRKSSINQVSAIYVR